MKIKTIEVQNDGYVFCKSRFYSSHDILQESLSVRFSSGTNKMIGEIDSGNWAVSYLLSMYKHRSKDFVLFQLPNVIVNESVVSIEQFNRYSCYLDPIDPLFSSHQTVENLINKGRKKSGATQTTEEIIRLFDLDEQRIKRPLKGAGNEIFRCMAAIGFANGKQVFCFPWLSKMRYDNFSGQIQAALDILDSAEMISLVPIGK